MEDIKYGLEYAPFAFADQKIIKDRTGLIIDIEYCYVNEAFEKMLGIKRENVVNKRASEVFPGVYDKDSGILGYFAAIDFAHVPITIERYFPVVGRWLLLSMTKIDSERFITYFYDISEHKKAKEELNNFFSLNLDLLCIASKDAKFLKVNNQWTPIMGYEISELIERDYFDLIHPDDIENTKKVQEKLNNNGSIVEFVNRLICKDGSYRTLEWNASTKNNLIYAIAHDITVQEEVENALKASEENLRTFFDSIDDFLFVLDNQGNITDINKTVTKRLGYSSAELIGKSVLIVHPEDRRQEAAEIVKDMLEGNADFCPVPLQPKEGNLIQVETRIYPGVWNGEPALFGVTKDVTRIKQSEERFSKAFHSGTSLMAISEISNGKFLDINEAFLNLTGYSREEVIGKTSTDLKLFMNDKVRNSFVEAIQKSNSIKDLEINVRMKNGEIRCGLFSITKMDIGEVPCWLTTMTDITERKKAEEALRQERDLFSDGPVFTVIWSVEEGWNLDYVSKNVVNALGYSDTELISQEYVYSDLIHPDDFPVVYKEVGDYIKLKASSFEQSYRLKHKDGSYRWFYDFTNLIYDSNDELVSIRGYLFDQSKLMQVESELAKERRRLRDVILATNIGTWEWNVVSGDVIFNERWAGILGYTLEELRPTSIQTWMNLAHPDDLAESNRLIEMHFRNESEYYEYECRMLHKDGYWVWVLDRGKVISWTKDGSPLLMSGTHQEITNRKQQELELFETRLRLELAMDAGEHGFWDWDLVSNKTYFSPVYYSMLGYGNKELAMSFDTFDYLIHPEDKRRVMPIIEKSISEGRNYEVEFRLKCKDGNYKWISGKGKGYFSDEIGKPYRAVGVHIDIDNQKKAQEKLKLVNTRFKEIAKQSRTITWEVDLDGNYLYISEVLKDVLGYEPEEVINKKKIYDFHPVRVKDKYSRKQIEIFSKGETYSNFENILQTKDGKEVWVSTSGIPVYDEYGKVVGYRGSDIDISIRKHAEQALKDSEDTLNHFFTQSTAGFFFMMLDEPVYWNDEIDKEATMDYIMTHHRMTKINQAMLDQYLAKEDDFIGLSAADMFASDIEYGRSVWMKFFNEGTLHIETNEKKFNGEEMFVLGDYVCLYDDLGRVTGHFGIQIDITEQKKAEQSLKESEEKFSSLLNSMSELVFMKDSDYKYIFANNAFLDYVNLKSEDLIGKTDYEIISHNLADKYNIYDKEAIINNKRSISSEIINNDIMETHKFPVKLSKDKVGVGCYIVDITERKLMEEKIKQSEIKFRTLFETLPTGVTITDTQGNIINTNSTAEKILGLSSEQQTQRQIDGVEWKIIRPDGTLMPPDEYASVRAFKENRAIYGVEMGIVRGLDDIGWIIVNAAPIENLGIVISYQEITDLKKAQLSLIESEEKFSSLLNSMSELVFLKDTNLNYVFANTALCDYFGMEKTDVIGKTDFEIMDFSSAEMCQNSDREAIIQNKRIISTEIIENIVLETHKFPVPLSKDKVGLGCYIVDVTERKMMEDKLIESDQLLKKLSKQIPGVIYQYQLFPDGNSFFPFVSQHINEIYEVDAELLAKDAKFVFERIHNEDVEVVKSSILNSFKTLEFWEQNYRVILPSKGLRWLNGVAKPEKQDDGSVIWYGYIADITDKMNADIELKRTKEQFALAVKGTNDGIWDWDLMTNELYLSPRWKEILGYQDHELENKFETFANNVYKEDRERVQNYVSRYLQNEFDKYEIEFRMYHKDGSLRWILAKGEAVRSNNGIPYRMAGSNSDITERKIVEQEIIATKEKLELSLDSGYIAWWIWDYETGIVTADKKKAEMIGYTQEEFPKFVYDITKLVHPEDYEPMMKNMEDHLSGKTAEYVVDYRIRTKQGGWKWYFDRGRIVEYSKNGKPKKISGVVIDITARKEVEAELVKKSKLQNILMNIASKNINIPISEFDNVINKSLKELAEFVSADRAYIFDYKWDTYTCDNTYEWCADGITPQIEELQGVPLNMMDEWVDNHKSGKTMYIPSVQDLPPYGVKDILEPQDVKSLIAVPMMDGEECIGFAGFDSVKDYHNYTDSEMYLLELFSQIIVNLSKRKIGEESLILARSEAEKANKAKSEFLANMSHEIRTPMNSILGFSEVMLNTVNDEKQKGYLTTILNSGKTLLSLINDILDLSKIEAGKLDITPEPTNIRVVLYELSQLFMPKVNEKDISFLVEMDESCPNSIIIDELRIRQILLNLIGNAVKFTKKGFVKLSFIVRDLRQDEMDIDFVIEDSGIGISEDNIDRIFEAFTQQSTKDTKLYGGTGLGLAITKRLCELMGGVISVESEVNRGSKFKVSFNNISYSHEEVLIEDLYSWNENEIIFKKSKILVVDDVKFNLKLLNSYLEPYNFEIYEAENGFLAIQITKEINPDLILMDIRMPGMDGYSATEHIKTNPKLASIPIIALTASALQSETSKINDMFDGYLRKPIQQKLLINEIKKHIEFEIVHSDSSNQIDVKSLIQEDIITDEIKLQYYTEFNDYDELLDMMIIDDLINFADRIYLFAEKHKLENLKFQSKELSSFIDDFRFDKIQLQMEKINNILKK